MIAKIGEDAEIVLATVHKDAVLYLIVPQVGVVVQRTELTLRRAVNVDIVAHVLPVLFQRAVDTYRQREAYIAVGGGFFCETPCRHLVQTGHQTVVSCDLNVDILDARAERHDLAMVVAVEIGHLVTGVGEVEHIVGFLRVEHQCALVAAHRDVDKVADDMVAVGLVPFCLGLQRGIVVGKFLA